MRKLFILVWLFTITVPENSRCSITPDTVYLRFKLEQPDEGSYFVVIGGYIHESPWYLPRAVFPAEAQSKTDQRVPYGQFTPWFNLTEYAGNKLHGLLNRSGGIAEFPNITVEFHTTTSLQKMTVVIELADAADHRSVIKKMEEEFTGNTTSFLVSPFLKRDMDQLETAGEMTERRLQWAKEVSGGRVLTPEKLIIQTSFWNPQRQELNLKEAEVLRLLGFNTLAGQMPEVRREFNFKMPGHSHNVTVNPGLRKANVVEITHAIINEQRESLDNGVPFGFSDETVCRPSIGVNNMALKHFYEWLAQKKIAPESLGAGVFQEIIPIETPEQLQVRKGQDGEAVANRIFYYTTRFRQEKANDVLRQFTESMHEQMADSVTTTTLVADHPYFSGSGLGMGMKPNPAWSGYPLALDWFDLGRKNSVDLIGIEDWLGLQYMYGPEYTWEGFQLIGFQASIFRSASGGTLPIITWITPSDETNLRLKAASALCQGAKHFFFWTYGPTATSTENYWSDLRGMYDGVYAITSQLARSEHILAEGKTRKANVALLYSISSDIWQPYGYVHMLERRATYLSLIHDQYLVDFISEEDIELGKLNDYDVLYVTDPCIKGSVTALIAEWVKKGGNIYGSCGAGSLNAFNEPVDGLTEVFGISPEISIRTIPASYHQRAALNQVDYIDTITTGDIKFGVLGMKVSFKSNGGKITGTFRDGQPAIVQNRYGKGRAMYVGGCPGISYIKDAGFVAGELKEQWTYEQRNLINVQARHVPKLISLSTPVVETGIFDSRNGTALVLANFTYQPIEDLVISISLQQKPEKVISMEKGSLDFAVHLTVDSIYPYKIELITSLDLNDIILFENIQ